MKDLIKKYNEFMERFSDEKKEEIKQFKNTNELFPEWDKFMQKTVCRASEEFEKELLTNFFF